MLSLKTGEQAILCDKVDGQNCSVLRAAYKELIEHYVSMTKTADGLESVLIYSFPILFISSTLGFPVKFHHASIQTNTMQSVIQ